MEKEMNVFEISEDEFYKKEMEANGVDVRARDDIFGWRNARENNFTTASRFDTFTAFHLRR